MSAAGDHDVPRRGRLPGGLTLRAMTPNAITTAALCSGLTGIRFAVTAASGTDPVLVAEDWRKAVAAVILAGLLDGIDGRIARLLKAQSRFGAELDSLADNVSFGVAPALILFLWSLQEAPRIGWFAALAVALDAAGRDDGFPPDATAGHYAPARRLQRGIDMLGSGLGFVHGRFSSGWVALQSG